MRNWALLLLVFLSKPIVLFASDFPSCIQALSDQDGDGFGFENMQTCIVDESTSSMSLPGVCIDDNADGYGWNGIATCVIEVIPNPDCVDTVPIGDGWGWDGNTSCRTVPMEVQAKSELEIIKENLLDVFPPGSEHHTVLFCPSTTESYILEIDGKLDYFIGTEYQSSGMWSSGMFEKDQNIHFFIRNSYSVVEILDTPNIAYRGEVCVFF